MDTPDQPYFPGLGLGAPLPDHDPYLDGPSGKRRRAKLRRWQVEIFEELARRKLDGRSGLFTQPDRGS